MVQIKISVAFVLVATAIAPIMIVALPVTLKNGSVLYYDMIDDYLLCIVVPS